MEFSPATIISQPSIMIGHEDPEVVYALSRYINTPLPLGLTAYMIANYFLELQKECWPPKLTCYKLIGFTPGVFDLPVFGENVEHVVSVKVAAANPDLLCKIMVIKQPPNNWPVPHWGAFH